MTFSRATCYEVVLHRLEVRTRLPLSYIVRTAKIMDTLRWIALIRWMSSEPEPIRYTYVIGSCSLGFRSLAYLLIDCTIQIPSNREADGHDY